MKVRIEIDETLDEEKVTIQCRQLNERIQKIQQFISQESFLSENIVVKRDKTEYYITLEDILFFETTNDGICAHTTDNLYKTEFRLYELEEFLPGCFLRISKSAIINVNHVYSVTKNLTASSVIEFVNTHKQVYVSRHYYKALANRLDEKWRRIR